MSGESDPVLAVLDRLAELVAAKIIAAQECRPPAPQLPPVDPLRSFTDKELCKHLGFKSPTTLWEIRRRGLLQSSFLYDGSRVRITTPAQLQAYYDNRTAHPAPVEAEGKDEDAGLDEKLAEVRVRRRARRRRIA